MSSNRLRKHHKLAGETKIILMLLNNKQLIWESIPDGILIAEKDGTIAYCNYRLGLIFGYNKHELIDQDIDVIIKNKIPVTTSKANLKVNPGRNQKKGKFEGLKKDGKRIVLDITSASLGPGTGNIILVIRDVTAELDELHQLRNTCNCFGRFASSMACELRQPLTALHLSVDMLEDSLLTGDKKTTGMLMKKMKQKVVAMDQMLREIFTYSNMYGQKPASEPDVNEPIEFFPGSIV